MADANRFPRLAALTVASLLAGAAIAEMSAVDAIMARQSNLKDLGGAFKAVRDQLRRPAPDMTQIQQASEQISHLASDMSKWFPQGSGPESGEDTDAKPEIWKDPQGFSEAVSTFTQAGPKLLDLAKANDVEGLKAQVGKVGQACKGCHDKFRVPQD
jgi:cytochrome c556